jgi:hypothetical protein
MLPGAGVISRSDVATVQAKCRNFAAFVLDINNERLLSFPLGNDGIPASVPASIVAASALAWAFSPDGTHVYAAGHQVSVFAVDAAAAYVTNADDGTIFQFRITAEGTLQPFDVPVVCRDTAILRARACRLGRDGVADGTS